jgi:hypothetical protein
MAMIGANVRYAGSEHEGCPTNAVAIQLRSMREPFAAAPSSFGHGDWKKAQERQDVTFGGCRALNPSCHHRLPKRIPGIVGTAGVGSKGPDGTSQWLSAECVLCLELHLLIVTTTHQYILFLWRRHPTASGWGHATGSQEAQGAVGGSSCRCLHVHSDWGLYRFHQTPTVRLWPVAEFGLAFDLKPQNLTVGISRLVWPGTSPFSK